MNHHPHALRRYSVASLVTGQVGHFWKAGPGQFSKVPKGIPACAHCNLPMPCKILVLSA
jgi:hypothetical protein